MYQLDIRRRAAKSLFRIPQQDAERVQKVIRGLAEEPRPAGTKKLTGRDAYRLRVGRYSVVYTIADRVRIVAIVDVGDRKDIYR